MTRIKNIGIIAVVIMFIGSFVYDCMSGDLIQFFRETSFTGLILSFIILVLLTIFLLNRFSKNKFWCNVLSWHKAPKKQNFDGASISGVCPRCDKSVLRDSQGNWF